MIISLSVKCFVVFFLYGIIDWIFKNIFARNVGGGSDG